MCAIFLLPFPENIHVRLLICILRMQMLLGHLLDHRKSSPSFLPEHLVGLRRPHLVSKENNSVVSNQLLHRVNKPAGGILHVDHVGSHDEIEWGIDVTNLILIVPVELLEFWGFGELWAVALDVAAESGEDGGDVGEENVGESKGHDAEAGGAAAGAELDGALRGEVLEDKGVVRVRVLRGLGGVKEMVEEFDEDEGAGPDGGADVHGSVVLLEGEGCAAHRKLNHRRVREFHLPLPLKTLQSWWLAELRFVASRWRGSLGLLVGQFSFSP